MSDSHGAMFFMCPGKTQLLAGWISKLLRVIVGCNNKKALAIRRIFSLVEITETKSSNNPNDFKIRLFG